ncbi:unnamed protein product, partial [Symbiodinium pilosum]
PFPASGRAGAGSSRERPQLAKRIQGSGHRAIGGQPGTLPSRPRKPPGGCANLDALSSTGNDSRHASSTSRRECSGAACLRQPRERSLALGHPGRDAPPEPRY